MIRLWQYLTVLGALIVAALAWSAEYNAVVRGGQLVGGSAVKVRESVAASAFITMVAKQLFDGNTLTINGTNIVYSSFSEFAQQAPSSTATYSFACGQYCSLIDNAFDYITNCTISSWTMLQQTGTLTIVTTTGNTAYVVARVYYD